MLIDLERKRHKFTTFFSLPIPGQGHVPMSQNPSYHTISYRVGPDGRAEMGGHGRELDRFFDGLGSGRVGSGFRNGRANSGGMFRRRMLPFRRWGFYRTF